MGNLLDYPTAGELEYRYPFLFPIIIIININPKRNELAILYIDNFRHIVLLGDQYGCGEQQKQRRSEMGCLQLLAEIHLRDSMYAAIPSQSMVPESVAGTGGRWWASSAGSSGLRNPLEIFQSF